ncbi:TPA: ead/Ea22-like family protein [Enterobacter roggenkampii]|nr:ead/Ea22-like family protein [Enterobacter roggenkampii]
MSNIDKRALREAAEKATLGRIGDRIDGSGSIKYQCFGNDGSLVLQTDHKNMEYGFIGENSEADELFFRMCEPATVLALLDELEAKDRRIEEEIGRANREHHRGFMMACGHLKEHSNVHYADAAEMEIAALRKRINKLEAREVKLPNPHAHLIWIQAGHAPDDYWDDVAVSHSEKDKCCDGSDRYPVYALWEIKEALSAIGINIAAAGKGE